jgi:hypothetical protein
MVAPRKKEMRKHRNHLPKRPCRRPSLSDNTEESRQLEGVEEREKERKKEKKAKKESTHGED